MQISKQGLEFIQDMEGCRLFAYLDTGGVWTIGIGHTGPEVVKGLRITMDKALEYLMEDSKEAQDAVNRYVKVTLSQKQFDALVSFIFNIGAIAFSRSTMLKKLNAGDYVGASKEFPRWNKDNGREILGLTKRRLLEQSMFNEGVA